MHNRYVIPPFFLLLNITESFSWCCTCEVPVSEGEVLIVADGAEASDGSSFRFNLALISAN